MILKVRASLALVPILLIFGCSKEQRDQIAEKVGQAKDQVASKASEVTSKASETASAAKEKVVADGQAKLKLDKELSFSASYVNLIPVKGRGSVVQLRSYSDSKSESFPSYFFQANSSAASLNSLTGQTVKGTLFIKRDKNEATWMSLPEQMVSLSFDSVVEGKLVGRVVDGKLNSAKGDATPVSGSFEAIVEGGLE
jgi:hypothetical protein